MSQASHVIRVQQGWLVTIVCLIGAVMIWGVIQVSSTTEPLEKLGRGVAYIADVDSKYDVESVFSLPNVAWQIEESEQLSFGMADHPYWFRFQIFPQHLPANPLMEIDYALLDRVDIWYFSDGELIAEQHGGDSFPFAKREIKHEKLLFELPQSAATLTLIVKVQTAGTVKLPIRLWDKDAFMVFNGEHNVAMGMFFGFMAAMALSNLFFFITSRSYTFLSYCGYVVFLALSLATLHGLGYKYLWWDNIWLQSRSVGIFATLTILCALIFSAQLLNVKNQSRILYRALRIAAGIFVVGSIASMIVPYAIYIKVFLVMLSGAVVLIYVVGILLWYKGVKLARFYTMAWTALLISAFITSLDNSNLIEMDTPSHYLLMFGATVETFMLALALALSYSQQRQDIYESQVLALQEERLEREAKENMLKLQEEAQEDLEYKVQERTLELEIALRELSETNRELEQKNTTDALTGIRNRLYFDKKYLAEVRRSRREQTEFSVVMIDIDHFKPINDEYGHITGDECIRYVASLLQKNLKRPSDDVCRYGGEEFALLLPNTDQEGAISVVESMREAIEQGHIKTSSSVIRLTISAGVCTMVIQSNEDEKLLLERADKALYQAKEEGRNKIVRFLPEQETLDKQESV